MGRRVYGGGREVWAGQRVVGAEEAFAKMGSVEGSVEGRVVLEIRAIL